MAKRGRPVRGLPLGTGFPNRLYTLRWSLKPVPTQQELARVLAMSRAYLSSLEAGSIPLVSEILIQRIAAYFNIEDYRTLAKEPEEPPLPVKPKVYRRGHTLNGRLMNVGARF